MTAKNFLPTASHPDQSISRLPRVDTNPGARCAILTGVAATLFILGIALPFVSIIPGQKLEPIGGFFVWLLSDDKTYSLVGSIIAIWNNNWVIGVLAFTFSLILPTAKIAVLSYSAFLLCRDVRFTDTYRVWAERLGPWSMLEVFLLAQTLLLAQSLPAGTAIYLRAGFYAFTCSVLLSLFAAWTLPKSTVLHDTAALPIHERVETAI
jgi:hypothetical protein